MLCFGVFFFREQIRPLDPKLGNQLGLHPGGSVSSQRTAMVPKEQFRSKQERATASDQPMENEHRVMTSVRFKNIFPLVTVCEIWSLGLRSRVVVFLCYQVLPDATHSPCCCLMSWHILTPCRRRSDFTPFACTPDFPLQESGGKDLGAGERIFLLVRLWLTGKS